RLEEFQGPRSQPVRFAQFIQDRRWANGILDRPRQRLQTVNWIPNGRTLSARRCFPLSRIWKEQAPKPRGVTRALMVDVSRAFLDGAESSARNFRMSRHFLVRICRT